jgi:hypothetical protein
MIITKEHQESWVNAYIKEKHTTDECTGFIDGIEKALGFVQEKLKPTNKLDSIYEFMISMGFQQTERKDIYKHKYFVNEHYIEFDLSACSLEKWAVMQHIFEISMSMGAKFKQIEICNVLGVAQNGV